MRSPDAPKMTKQHGSAGAAVLAERFGFMNGQPLARCVRRCTGCRGKAGGPKAAQLQSQGKKSVTVRDHYADDKRQRKVGFFFRLGMGVREA